MSRRTKTSLARKCFAALNSCFIMIVNKEKENQLFSSMHELCPSDLTNCHSGSAHGQFTHMTGFLNMLAQADIRIYAITLQQSMFQILSCIGDSCLLC